MPEREIIWGPDESTADYATRIDTDDNDRAKLLETADGDTVLLEWDGDAGEWVYGGPVNLDGADVDDVGTLNAESVDTDEINDGGPLSDGDGTERQIWIIANGASDPSGADSEDIIFEEEK